MADEWVPSTLGAITPKDGYGLVDGPFGSNLPASCYTDSGIPVIRGSNLTLGNSRFKSDEFVFVSPSTAQQLARSTCRPLDIVFTKKGTLGQAGLVPESGPYEVYLLSSNQMKLSVDRRIADPYFVYYYVSSPASRTKIIQDSEATGVPKTNVAYLREFPILLPSLKEQQAIGQILRAFDDKIELNRRMNQTVESIARAIFQSWFVDFDPVQAKIAGLNSQVLAPVIVTHFPDTLVESPIGQIPAGWPVQSLGDVCEKPQYGYTASASAYPVGPKFLRITDINKHDCIEWDKVPYCAIDDRDRPKYSLKKGDVVIARMADPGHGALVEEDVDAVFASYLIRFRPQQPEIAHYIQYWLRSRSYWHLVDSRQSGTTRANLNAQVLAAFALVVPPPEVMAIFAAKIAALREIVIRNVCQSRTLATLRDTLLPKLISGELRVPDAERIVGRML